MRATRSTSRRAVAVAVTTLALAGLGACATEEPAEPTASPSPTAEPSAEPTPTEEPAGEVDVAVHYVVDTRAGLRLAREWRTVPDDEPLQHAVEAMISGPEDPDYTTTWNPATTVLSVASEPGSVTVDLSADARTANVGSEGAALMIQQLVHTATALDPEAAVTLLIEGEPAGELWGAVVWDEPVLRADPLGTRVLTQIDEPREGATATSPVRVAGEAAAFEANVPWQVLDESGAEVTSGFTMTSEGMTFAPFGFDVELEPGTYTVVITEDDPSDGAAGTPMSDSRTFTVE
ncbi:hypothetical protein GXB85_15570 [Cellulomonas sp. APG4]|uniref:Gmad2 immunoglobulin-like domain-containing protein n=1 Tax=Cellulomonas sp. APG4 TaxID=1538656 RepID=UPI00137949B4|nr:Gmad2 immunoglobulin-like domain-containing protein [Cellulomonas sp. APG4]NCT92358.1 hypothetical protein [Cellulomonas sp. APG4]